jgi:hypothetical protein
MSFKAEVIADSSGEWVSNALRFSTVAEARSYVEDLQWRWTAVRDTRTMPSDDAVNSAWINGLLIRDLDKVGAK